MCGIVGFRTFERQPSLARELEPASVTLRHRGPDDSGLWVADDEQVGLGFRRLSILDLSPLGHQPMASASGRWTMVYNGEVYNFRSIRHELEARGHRFRSTGDTEVVLTAFSEWGVEAVRRFVGMFAIALWDAVDRELHLVRDRLGVKPLYYFWDGRTLLFGSELKALRAFSGWSPEVDRSALGDFLRYGYIGDPLSIYRGVKKLRPAHRLTLAADGSLTEARYWSPFEQAGERATRSEHEIEAELEELLHDAFPLRLVSDRPVGVFLSGGVDSSLVASVLQESGDSPIETFTIGFDAGSYDESRDAERVAAHLGTSHHARILRSDDARTILSRWGDLFDEPFGDESGIATFLVAEFAARHVTVALSADGGDELFSGYASYTTALDRVRRVERIREPWRTAGVSMLGLLGPLRGRAYRLDSIYRQLRAGTPGRIFDDAVSIASREDVTALLGEAPPERKSADDYPGEAGERFCAWDVEHYLPGDILTKVDRTTMATSLEGREPLLDHRIVEFAFSLPFSSRRGPLGPKHALKRALYERVPRGIVDRPKQGFAVPVTDWLRGDLRGLVDGLLESPAADHLDGRTVSRWIERMDDDPAARRRVWLLVAFDLWYRRWMSG